MTRLPLSLALLTILSSTALAQSAPAPAADPPDPAKPVKSCSGVPITFHVTHEEAGPKRDNVGGTSIVGVIRNVADQIRKADEGGPPRNSYPITLTPIVERRADGSTRTRFDVASREPSPDPKFAREARAEFERNRRLTEGQLRRFERVLPADADPSEMFNIKGPALNQPRLAGVLPEDIALCDPDNPVISLDIEKDPQTGEWKIRRRLADGTLLESRLTDVKTDGDAIVLSEHDGQGNRRNTTIWPDGTVSTERIHPNGDIAVSVLNPDGTLEHTIRERDGRMTSQTLSPDGTLTTERRIPGDTLSETVTRYPDGTIDRRHAHGGGELVVPEPDGGATITEVDNAGNTVTARFDRDGNRVSHERENMTPSEPGRRYYEDVVGGRDWDKLTPSRRDYYDSRERARDNTLLNRAQQAANEAVDRRRDAEHAAANARITAEGERKLEAIRQEHADAERKLAEQVAAREARTSRRNAIEHARKVARQLDQDYGTAQARGDKVEMQRIAQKQDEHEAASRELMMPTPEEALAMEQQDELRVRLRREIGAHSRNVAEMENAQNEAKQDDIDRMSGKASWISAGAAVQQANSRTNRTANREFAHADATIGTIDSRLADPRTNAEERRLLGEMRDAAMRQRDAAADHLSASGAISAAGYAVDVAMTVGGAKLFQGVAQAGRAANAAFAAGSRGTARVVGAVLPNRAGSTVAGAIDRVGRAVTTGTARETIGIGMTRLATAPVSVALGEQAGARVASALAMDVGTPAVNAAGRGARVVLGDRVVESAKAAAQAAARVATTDIRDIPGRLRSALVQRPAAEGATGALREIGEETSRAARAAAEAGPSGASPAPATQTPRQRQALADAPAVNPSGSAGRGPTGTSRIERPNLPGGEAVDRIAGADIIPHPAPAEQIRQPLTQEQMNRLFEPGRTLNRAEIGQKIDILAAEHRSRVAVRQAVEVAHEARSAGQPQAVIDRLEQNALDIAEAARPHNSAVAQAKKSGRPNVVDTGAAGPVDGTRTGPGSTVRLPRPPDASRSGPGETVRLPDRGDVRLPSGPGETVRLPPPISGPQASRQLAELASDSAVRRADYAMIPAGVRNRARDEMLRTIEQAAVNDPRAARVQRALADGSLAVELDPALKAAQVPLRPGRVALNPMAGERMKTGRELAEQLLAPQPSPRGRPGWWDKLEGGSDPALLRGPDGLTGAERVRMKAIERELMDKRGEFVPDPARELQHEAAINYLERERKALGGEAELHARRVQLRDRQIAAPDYEVAPGMPGAMTPQPHAEAGQIPLRSLVEGDQRYLANIMGHAFVPTQKRIYVNSINRHVQHLLNGGSFPVGESGAKIQLVLHPSEQFHIGEGHHRLIAAQIVSRLTGRPLLPGTGFGARSVIPAEAIEIHTAEQWAALNKGAPGRTPSDWTTIGVIDQP